MRHFALGLLVTVAPAVALDLEPKQGFRELERARIPMIEFKDNNRVVQWSPPAGWRMSFDQGILSLRATEKLRGGMELRIMKKTAGDLSLLSKAETIPQFCAPFLPPTVKKLTYRETSEGAFTIGPIPAREYVLDVEEQDRTSKASVFVVEYSQQQRLIVVVTAHPNDFAAVREEAIQSLFSWRTE